MPSLLATLGLAAVSTAVVWVASVMLERASKRLSDYYGLPPIVTGAIVVAVGSSFPELSSTVLATLLHGEFDLGVGVIVGSAVFNVLVIPALSSLAADELPSSRDLVFKESLFYMLSISVLLITFALATIYVPSGTGEFIGTMTRPLALLPLGLYVIYVFIQYADVADHRGSSDKSVDALKEWGKLAVSLVLIVVSVEGLVRAALSMGEILDTPSYIWGLTIIAIATSLPDAFVSIQAARYGRAETSIANVLGSNTFDLCVAVPVGVLIAGASLVDFAAAVPMMAALTVATIVLFALLRRNLDLSKPEAVALLACYGVFLVFVLETGGLIGLTGAV